ncbi:polysaccharide biosynthesis tyrosine autokinase [Hyunsoonleella sp. SJ7]|uniref:non-specific protein-tyrosine kinase n=1 Tax=Hyunsoonleella aquatilis TaxID=2762758 RepID=A0A923HIH4_9FLAO|nr:tyrosine-protein kinase [Hyunsoonleella aquatilis]MBC3758972.1 polysaccharide biosynthesis tyrosine autokinase [Hyunsoonleella aquatilis]
MEKGVKKHNQDVANSKVDFDLKKLVSKYTKHWKWFALSCIFFLVLAYFHLRYAEPEFNAYAKIMLVHNKGNINPAQNLLQDLGQNTSEMVAIEDEIEVLKSRKLMTGVVEKLDLNIRVYAKGRLHDTQYFPNDRAPITINFIETDSVIRKSNFVFSLIIKTETTFDFIYHPVGAEEPLVQTKSFGNNISSPVGDIVLTPNFKNLSYIKDRLIYVRITPVKMLAEQYKNSILISPAGEFSNVINLSLDDTSADRAKAIIDTLIEEYNDLSVQEKSNISNNTAEFIDKRINLIATDLSKVDDEIERFKTGNKLTDITSEAQIYLDNNALTEQELAKARTQYSTVNFMKEQVNDDSFQRIPTNLGLEDGAINSLASKYNELLDQRQKLLQSSNEKNPIIVNLDEQIKNIKDNLRQTLNNSSSAVDLRIRSLQNQTSKFSQKIYALPGQVRKSRDIEREQSIKESLYLYLLQKREEATISLISAAPNAKIVDQAHSDGTQVSPKVPMVYAAAIMLGLCIPFAFFYVKDLMDNKIHNKEDLEKVINNIPVLGEIPRISGSDKDLIQRNDRSILSESFRIIRTNLDYVRKRDDAKPYSNVVFVTSTINGEGKSFFSLNMALTVANTGKRVLLIGADIRKPKTQTILKGQKSKASDIGLTEFLADKSVTIGDVTNTHEVNSISLDLLVSGKVPPNPAELLMSDRMKQLFDKVSNDYDYIIVDTAPSMLVTDTLLFSQYAGYTIYMTRAGYTEKEVLNFAKELHADKKLNGMMLVVNDVNQSNFGYGAKYGYYGAPKKKGLFRWKKASA